MVSFSIGHYPSGNFFSKNVPRLVSRESDTVWSLNQQWLGPRMNPLRMPRSHLFGHMYEDFNDFAKAVVSTPSQRLSESWLRNEDLFVFSDAAQRNRFFQVVERNWDGIEYMQCAGTANWRYSLNPEKGFREFSSSSDIDVVVVSKKQFEETWDRIRLWHRDTWYRLRYGARNSLLRNGQNIYAGFVSPEWIPDKADRLRFEFRKALQRCSISEVGYRSVNMFFFRNYDEAVDYYRRGIEAAKKELSRGV